MKRRAWLIGLIPALTWLASGCGGKANTSKLEAAFKTADAATQAMVAKAVTAIKRGDYAAAATELQRVSGKGKQLTPEQRQELKDMMEKLLKLIADKG